MYSAYYRLYWRTKIGRPVSTVLLVGVPIRNETVREIAMHAYSQGVITIEEFDRAYRFESIGEEEYEDALRV